jgi:prepilin-type N-terminal cleavage/methylation domain-containing protein
MTAFRNSKIGSPAATPSAFTLLEVLLAVAIAGFVLAAASSMMVSITNIWTNRQASNFFQDHVDGVAEFVQSCFTRAGTEIALSSGDSPATPNQNNNGTNGSGNPPQPTITIPGQQQNRQKRSNPQASDSGGSLLRRSEDPIGWAKPPGFAGYRDPLLNFKLRDNPPLLVNDEDAPATGVDAFLYFDRDEGLSLIWYSLLQEEVEDESDLRRTPISPYVTSVSYIYWDERFERWEEEDEPQEGEDGEDEYLLPRFIKLVFERDDVTEERTISIPVPSRSALLF